MFIFGCYCDYEKNQVMGILRPNLELEERDTFIYQKTDQRII